jgi:ribosomal protein S18 acetylase RimI-like enzyme
MPARLGREASARVDAFQVASRALLVRFDYQSSWFLSGLGVDPDAQRRGIGTALVRWGLERAAESRRPAVLLTSNAENIPFYERLGLVVAAEEELPRGGVRTWAMRTR